MRLVAQRPAHHGSKLPGPLQRPCIDDRAGDPARPRLLAIAIDDVGNILFRGGVEEIGRTHAALAHRHVERAVRLEGKAAFGPVELHRRHADIQRDARHATDAALGQQLLHPRKFAGDQRDTLFIGQRLPFPDRIGVAIKGKDLRASRRHGAGIAARAERAVDMPLARGNGERIEHFGQEDRDMRRGAHLPPSAARCSSQRRTLLRISAGRSGLSTSASGFQIWK